jgi:uncharacterized protein YjbI with pentapeptide repeats/archaellum biogenesis ATPase FlaH
MKIKFDPDDQFAGAKFEAYVGTLYHDLGYRVTPNVNLTGQQVDLLAEKNIAGAGQSRLAIECKYQSKGNLSNQKVFEFIAVAETLIRHDRITKAVMVTNTGYTDGAWVAASKNQFVELITARALEDELFDLGTVYRSFVDTYEAKKIFSQYVALNGIYDDGQQKKKEIEDIERFLLSWLKEPQDKLMTIFGDFGSGKTTLLNRIKYMLAKAYIHKESTLKPFLVNLKDFYKYDTIEKLLAFSAKQEFEREVSIELIFRQLEAGQIVLLLDGFDEMAQQIDTDIRVANFLQLSRLLRHRTILTCRPSYFVSRSEYKSYIDRVSERSALRESTEAGSYKRNNMAERELMNKLSVYLSELYVQKNNVQAVRALEFNTIDVAALSAVSIDEYLLRNDLQFKKILGFNWQYVKSYLEEMYDISDLMTRPMLLEMIVNTLLSGALELRQNKTNIGPGGLYELYTSTYFDIDFDKSESRKLFGVNQRRALATSNALLMFRSGASEISHNELLLHISGQPDLHMELGDISHLSYEQIVADIQITTFLIPGTPGKFRFAHKSFMEFFAARYLKQHIEANNLVQELYEYLPKEVLYFLGSFCAIWPEINSRLVKWFNIHNQEPGKEKLLRNIAGTLLYGGAVIQNIDWQGVEISAIEFKRRTLQNSHFEKVNIFQVDFVKARIYNSNWNAVYLREVSFTDCELHGSVWSVIIDELRLMEVMIYNSNLNLAGKGISFQKCSIKDAKLAFSGNTLVSDCRFTGATINWGTAFPGNVAFQRCNFNQGQIIWPLIGKVINYQFNDCVFDHLHLEFIDNGFPVKTFEKCVFENCIVSGLRLDLHMVKTSIFKQCEGYVLLEERAVDPKYITLRHHGNISYFKKDELYYIPQSSWELCKSDFKTFREKIKRG